MLRQRKHASEGNCTEIQKDLNTTFSLHNNYYSSYFNLMFNSVLHETWIFLQMSVYFADQNNEIKAKTNST